MRWRRPQTADATGQPCWHYQPSTPDWVYPIPSLDAARERLHEYWTENLGIR